jgi:hydroxypyruvate isomerase
MINSRREFLKNAAITGIAVSATPSVFGSETNLNQRIANDTTSTFKLKYAPGFGFFREHAGTEIIDNIKFCYDTGFRAMFDNGLMKRPVEEQLKLGDEMKRLSMELGPFVIFIDRSMPTFVINKPETREMLINKMKEGVEAAKRTGGKWALIDLGIYDGKLHRDFQTANVIDNLRYCCDIVEPAGLTLVLEPLNTHTNHPGRFLNGIPQAYAICKGVNRRSCKIVNDLYHQQITEGNLIPNMEAAWSEIASFHIGDNPGRNEPGTGEINYRNIFKYIYNKKYDGVLCMEHGISNGTKQGESLVIQAYRECDSFEF